LRVRERDQRALGGRVGRIEIQVDVAVDHARKHGRRAEVEHRRAGGNLHPRADLGDALAPDDDHLAGEHLPERASNSRPARIATSWFGGARNFLASGDAEGVLAVAVAPSPSWDRAAELATPAIAATNTRTSLF